MLSIACTMHRLNGYANKAKGDLIRENGGKGVGKQSQKYKTQMPIIRTAVLEHITEHPTEHPK